MQDLVGLLICLTVLLGSVWLVIKTKYSKTVQVYDSFEDIDLGIGQVGKVNVDTLEFPELLLTDVNYKIITEDFHILRETYWRVDLSFRSQSSFQEISEVY